MKFSDEKMQEMLDELIAMRDDLVWRKAHAYQTQTDRDSYEECVKDFIQYVESKLAKSD